MSDTRPTAAHLVRRRDSAITRDKLLDAAGRLLAKQGTAFSLPDLARSSGVSPATVYRHFNSTQEVFREFYERMIVELVEELREAGRGHSPLERFARICVRWTDLATQWGTAAAHIRSAQGFLERSRSGEPQTSALHDTLAPVVEALIAEGHIPDQDIDYAILLWVDIFDERAVVDLTSTLGWTSRHVARALSGSVLAILRAGSRTDEG